MADFIGRQQIAATNTIIGGIDNVNNTLNSPRVLAQAPASNDYGLAVRVIGGSSPALNSSGWTPFTKTTNLDKSGFQIKATGGLLGYFAVRNTDATAALYVSFYNAATKTGSPVLQIEIAGSSAWTLEQGAGITFLTAIFVTFSSNLAVSSDPSTSLNVVNGGYV